MSTTLFNLKATCIALALSAIPMAHALAMTQADYDAALKKCEPMTGDDKAQCTEKARQDWAVEQRKGGKMGPVGTSRGPGYMAALKNCDSMTGDDKAKCTEEVKLKYPPKRPMATSAAGRQRDADRKAELMKCDPMTGDDKAKCTEAAELKYPRS